MALYLSKADFPSTKTVLEISAENLWSEIKKTLKSGKWTLHILEEKLMGFRLLINDLEEQGIMFEIKSSIDKGYKELCFYPTLKSLL